MLIGSLKKLRPLALGYAPYYTDYTLGIGHDHAGVDLVKNLPIFTADDHGEYSLAHLVLFCKAYGKPGTRKMSQISPSEGLLRLGSGS